ncbi:uncharacterized protein DUF726 [Rhodococcus rhodochrous J45]|uniref:Uncharacterized protein DUF726 n=2 Tax=Rhodococcus rhodochrous TaxID=1829 RepID=A0A562E6L3_RHORH|nr:uncharacterized protein DUF726 [Rhodococcus rhodochrous J45]
MGAVHFTSGEDGTLTCEVRSLGGRLLRLTGNLATVEPLTSGDAQMVANKALAHNAWAYVKHETEYQAATEDDQRKSHRKQADEHAAVAEGIANLIDDLADDFTTAWCSGCFMRTEHRKVHGKRSGVRAHLCASCGVATVGCAAPQCVHMATRGLGSFRIPRYCAEHRHDIPSFERATDTVEGPEDYGKLLKYDKPNLNRATKLAAAGVLAAGVAVPGGIAAAPAVGGAIGALMGYSGAVAANVGLAFLGGGAVAAGGLGIAGGTYVVAAVGAALGGALGASVTNAYVNEDKSFEIEKFREGVGIPVIVTRGFLNESSSDWRAAIAFVERRYPDAPIYKLHWGSKELAALGVPAARGAGARYAMGAAARVAARAGKAAAGKLNPIAPVMMAADLAKNPWHTARVRADRTGVALAGILARTEISSYHLVGHSLGARVMITAAETLSTQQGGPRIDTIHVVGAAIGRKGDWRKLNDAVSNKVHSYFSSNDKVLRYAYAAAQGGSVAAGYAGFGTSYPNIVDHDVSSCVDGHSEYFSKVTPV